MKIDLWNFVFVNVFRPRNLAISSDNRLFWTVPHDILRTKQGMNKIQRTMKQEPAWFEHFVSSTSSDTQYACFFEQCHTTYLEPSKEWTRFNGRWSRSQHGWNILFRPLHPIIGFFELCHTTYLEPTRNEQDSTDDEARASMVGTFCFATSSDTQYACFFELTNKEWTKSYV